MHNVVQGAVYCPTCGQAIGANARFCMNCGNAIPTHAASFSGSAAVAPVAAPSPETFGAANIALVMETIPGFFGLLGLGHVFSGKLWLGIGVMFAWFAYIIVGSAITSLTLGAAGCATIPILIAVPIVSGYMARTRILKTGGKGHWKPVLFLGGLALLLVALAVMAVFLMVLFSGRYY